VMRASIGIDARMHLHTGIGRYVTALLHHFKNHKEEVGGYKISVFLRREVLQIQGLQEISVMSKPFSVTEQIEMPLKLAKGGIDLLHSPQFNIPLMSPAVQVTTIHDCAYDRFPEEFPSRKAKMYYKVMFPMALRKSKRIIAVSESTKRDLIELYRISPAKISVIYEGVDDKFFRDVPNERVNRLRKELGLYEPFALYVGLTRPRKNLERLLRAFAEIVPSLKDGAKLVLAGKVDTRFLDVRKLAKQLNIDNHIVQLGFVSEEQLLPLYKAATFLVLPSLYEGFGLPVLEAMATGLPVITSNVSSLPEVAGDAAILVDPYSTEEIAEAMYTLFTDGALGEELSRKGVERAKQFSWTKCAQETLKLYEEVLNGR